MLKLIFIVLFSGVLWLGGSAATVFDVDVADVALLNQAITDANNNPGQDTVRIRVPGLYSGDIVWPTQSIVIEATVAGVVIEKSVGDGQVFRCDPGGLGRSDLFIIRGASAEAKLTIRNGVSAIPLVNTGPTTQNNHTIILENVVLERPAVGNASTNSFVNFNNACAEAHQLINVDFVGGATTNTQPIAAFGSLSGAGVVLSNCDFSAAHGPAPRVVVQGPNDFPIVLANCILSNSGEESAPVLVANNNSDVTLVDCAFATGPLSAAIYPQNYPHSNGFRVKVIRPTFVGPIADIFMHAPSGYRVDYAVEGDANEKFNFDDFGAHGGRVFARITEGEMSMVDCTATNDQITTFDIAFQGAITGAVSLFMNRCIWVDGAGWLWLVDRDENLLPTVTEHPITFTAINTVWRGTTERIVVIDLHDCDDDGARIVPATVEFVHCTMAVKTGGVHLGVMAGPDYVPEQVCADVVIANLSIFDAAGNEWGTSCFSAPLLGRNNILWNGNSNRGVFMLGAVEPSFQRIMDPLLDNNGLIGPDSPAVGVAHGSLMAEDVYGQSRPMPEGTWPDLGAYEEQSRTIQPSSHAGWSLYQ